MGQMLEHHQLQSISMRHQIVIVKRLDVIIMQVG